MALFRATADLWDHGSGRIVRPTQRCLCFLPERPYLPPGTLREILVSGGQHVEAGQPVLRLDSYEIEHAELFHKVLDIVQRRFMPIVIRHAISGHAIVNNEDSTLLDNPLSLAMVIDIFSERGFHAVIDIHPVDDEYHGSIAWLLDKTYDADDGPALAGKPLLDHRNPDPALRSRFVSYDRAGRVRTTTDAQSKPLGESHFSSVWVFMRAV